MSTDDLIFYKAPLDKNGKPLWVPIVIKNKDQLIGFIDGVNMTASIYDIDRESMFYTLSSERFNDVTKSGTRLRHMDNNTFYKHAVSILEDGYSRVSALESKDSSGSELNDFCLTVQCKCGNFVGFFDYDRIPTETCQCDMCENILIHYTGVDDCAFVYDGINTRNNETLLALINSIQESDIEEETTDSEQSSDW